MWQVTNTTVMAVAALALGLSTMAQAAMFQTIAPSGLNAETQVGPQGFTAPVNVSARTYQIQYGASRLGDLSPGEQITGLQWRLQTTQGSQTNWDGELNWSDFRVTLAQAANAVTAMSTTFADNMVNPTLVRSGPLVWHTSDFPFGSTAPTPNAWGPLLTFDVPYTYQGGDLILFLQHSGNGHGERHLDGAHAGSDGWTTDYRGFTANSADATTALAVSGDNYDRVVVYTQFTVIPEPASVALLGLGGVMMLWRRRNPATV